MEKMPQMAVPLFIKHIRQNKTLIRFSETLWSHELDESPKMKNKQPLCLLPVVALWWAWGALTYSTHRNLMPLREPLQMKLEIAVIEARYNTVPLHTSPPTWNSEEPPLPLFHLHLPPSLSCMSQKSIRPAMITRLALLEAVQLFWKWSHELDESQKMKNKQPLCLLPVVALWWAAHYEQRTCSNMSNMIKWGLLQGLETKTKLSWGAIDCFISGKSQMN